MDPFVQDGATVVSLDEARERRRIQEYASRVASEMDASAILGDTLTKHDESGDPDDRVVSAEIAFVYGLPRFTALYSRARRRRITEKVIDDLLRAVSSGLQGCSLTVHIEAHLIRGSVLVADWSIPLDAVGAEVADEDKLAAANAQCSALLEVVLVALHPHLVKVNFSDLVGEDIELW